MLRRAIKRTVAVLLLLFAFAALVAGCAREAFWEVGAIAPEISVLDLSDRTVKLSDYRGQVVVLRFWSSDCKACVTSMPALDSFSAGYREKGLTVVAVNLGDAQESVAAFAARMNLSYPLLLDPLRIAAGKYGVTAVPTTFFIDRAGIGRKVVIGEVTQKMFEKTVGGLL
jgi:peroxiredoxin